jgi:hypothetical protein
MTNVVTKIELVTEAIEALTLAQVVLCSGALSDHEQALSTKNLTDARASLSHALGILMTPTLRVLNGPGRIDPPENVPYGGKGIEGMNLA